MQVPTTQPLEMEECGVEWTVEPRKFFDSWQLVIIPFVICFKVNPRLARVEAPGLGIRELICEN